MIWAKKEYCQHFNPSWVLHLDSYRKILGIALDPLIEGFHCQSESIELVLLWMLCRNIAYPKDVSENVWKKCWGYNFKIYKNIWNSPLPVWKEDLIFSVPVVPNRWIGRMYDLSHHQLHFVYSLFSSQGLFEEAETKISIKYLSSSSNESKNSPLSIS